jgi:hypothetical protein
LEREEVRGKRTKPTVVACPRAWLSDVRNQV